MSFAHVNPFASAWFGYAHQPSLSILGESRRAQKIEFCLPDLKLKKRAFLCKRMSFLSNKI